MSVQFSVSKILIISIIRLFFKVSGDKASYFFESLLDTVFLWSVSSVCLVVLLAGTLLRDMSWLAAKEAGTFLQKVSAFFNGKGVDIHCIRVLGLFIPPSFVSLVGPGNCLSHLIVGIELDSLLVPVGDGGGNCFSINNFTCKSGAQCLLEHPDKMDVVRG